MGSLVLGRKDDGTLEILRADDEIELADELLPDIPDKGDYRYDGNGVLTIEASGQFIAYVMVSHDADRHVYHFVRTADHEGR